MSFCNRSIASAALLLMLLIPAGIVMAANEADFEVLKQNYFSLRNTDPDVTRVDDWKMLTAELLSFREKRKDSPNAPSALFYAAILSSTVGDIYQEEECTRLALSALEDLVNDYPKSDLADDALLMEGDLRGLESGGKDKARSYYERVLSDYRQGDMVLVARERLRTLSGKQEETAEAATLPWEAPDVKINALRVVIDPGHGGEDRGAVGEGSLFEKDVTLSVALEAEQLLEAQGYEVLLTREGDVFVPLAERAAFANASNAAVYVSLHTNASIGAKNSGIETYILENSNNEAARKLAERENASGAGEGGTPGDLEFIVSDMIQKGKTDASKKLAETVQRNILAALRAGAHSLPDLGVQKGPFYVLVGAHMPCILVEMGFIDNAKDEKLLSDKEFRAKLAKGIAAGVAEFVNKGSPHE